MDVTKSYKLMKFGDIHGPKPYDFVGSRATIIKHTHRYAAHGEHAAVQTTRIQYPQQSYRKIN